MYTDIDFTKVNTDGPAPVNEPDRQYYYIRKCQEYIQKKEEELGRKLTFCTQTFAPATIYYGKKSWKSACRAAFFSFQDVLLQSDRFR